VFFFRNRSKLTTHGRQRIVILGGGFAGVYAALRLEKALARNPDIEIVLVSRENFLLFTPMLHEVAAGELAPWTSSTLFASCCGALISSWEK
jgi:NADH dehydrogenase FAD-containing subunit